MNRLIGIVATLLLLVGLLGPGALHASAQQDKTGERGDETTEESPAAAGTYTSPTYGYTVSYDDSWDVAQDETQGGYDVLQLNSEDSALYFEGYPDYDGDPETCIADQLDQLQSASGVDNYALVEDENGDPIEEYGANRSFALVQVTVTTDDGTTGDLVIYLECQPLVPEVAVLLISQYMGPDVYESELERKDDVVNTLEFGDGSVNEPGNNGSASNDEEKMLDLLETTEADVDAYWTALFDVAGWGEYEAPTYVNFTSEVQTSCGNIAPSEVGPFYCGPDKTVYFDVNWMLDNLEPYGDFIISVVVAHEVGHHVQELLGIDKCDVTQCLNGYTSLQIELMADCFAGSWSQLAHERGQLVNGDVEGAIVALSEFLGDPAYMDSADASAHGPGSLRTWWFLRGYYESASACVQQPEN